MIELSFSAGTIDIRGLPQEASADLPPSCQWDKRTQSFRAQALDYAAIVLRLIQNKQPYSDQARDYDELTTGLSVRRAPRPFQTQALDAWNNNRGRGSVILPTGAGKSHVALLAIDSKKRNTLVIAPTLDLVAQWYDLLRTSFRCDVGIIGGGEYNVLPLTVSTYDSAYMYMENLGAKFGLVVFDECHHLPGDAYAIAAKSCLAPFRLGLTATLERADGRHHDLEHLIGPTVFSADISQMTGDYLAKYSVEQILVELTEQEQQAYVQARQTYRDFVRRHGIRMASPDGWSEFIFRSSISAEGRAAMNAYQQQKQLAFAAPSKLVYVDHLLHQHRRDRVLLFTESNRSAYEMSRRFLVPVITHQTKVTERSAILQSFAQGTYNILATSKVLNEGVDIPDANVGIIFSGSGSVREHVQRLGRILRKVGDKRAHLYELVSSDTSEMYTSNRRREHSAYR